jgi:hypothetical protein
MKTRMMITTLLYGGCLLAVGCTTTERAPTDPAPLAASVMEVPVIPDELPGGQEPSISEASGEVQERAVARIAPGVIAPGTAVLGVLSTPSASSFPGEFAIRTQKGYYLTAITGGGRPTDPTVITGATSAGAWEKFKLAIATPPSPHDKTIQTASGHYVSAVNGGGMTANAVHTDATQPRDWERFRIIYLGVGVPAAPTFYAIQTIKGNYLTAMGAGGKYQDALHTDARDIKGWEQFRIVKCGDLGSGYEYAIMAADGEFLAATHWEGKPGFGLNNYPSESDMKYKLIRQSDGTYALLTANGRNYVTALGGGGQVEKYDKKYYTPDCGGLFGGPCIGGSAPIFHTDATQVKGWEKFRVIDQGNCTYAVQTPSGFYVGIYKDSSGVTLLTTRRDGASTANEKFQLVVFGLASPVVLQ